MTANELADLLDFDAKTLNWKAFADAATMLRQQQAEIKQLRKVVEDTIGQAFYEDDYHKAQAEIEALKEARCVACGWNPNLIRGERNDSGFYMSDAEHYKLKCESQQAEIEKLKLQLEYMFKQEIKNAEVIK